jgi:clan AA aspartic protease
LLKPARDAESVELIVWVDTAFTGELAVPRVKIRQLGLHQSAAVLGSLADGREVVLETYSCLVSWFGQDRLVEAIASDGRFPLLGIGLLRDRRLAIDFPARTLSVE